MRVDWPTGAAAGLAGVGAVGLVVQSAQNLDSRALGGIEVSQSDQVTSHLNYHRLRQRDLMSTTWREGLLAAVLIGATVLLAAGMGLTRTASWLESASFVTGAACVWLTVKENVWNFPIGLVNVATFGFVFLRARLYADAGLQIVYLILCARGWYLWLRLGRDGTRLHVTRAGREERNGLLVCIILLTLLLWLVLRQVGGSASFWDALTTSISLGSQWLLNRKRLESWMGWISVDAIYVPLYVSKSLYLTAVLYAIFLGLAILGLRRWHETLVTHHA